MGANVPDVPGGGGALAGAIGVVVTAVATYLGTRYTTRAGHQQSLNDVARQEIEQIFARHAVELKDRDARHERELKDRDHRISLLEDKLGDVEQKNDLCEARVLTLQREINDLRHDLNRALGPWDGQTDRRRND